MRVMESLSNSESNISIDAPVDDEIAGYLNLELPRNFFLFAGAGSGKTRSLIRAMGHIRDKYGESLKLRGRKVCVITYTNAACDEIHSRIDNHPLFHVSTIHSFAWDLIKNFNHDIREWFRKNLRVNIENLKEMEAKGRKGTKASDKRIFDIESKKKKLRNLDTNCSFSYSPNGENSEVNSLNHEEVISICSDFLVKKELMRWILVGRYPFLLIDESQDTKQNLIDALFVVAEEHTERFSIGLFGDAMQRIYTHGKEQIEAELPGEWNKPVKRLNHRCPNRIVKLINNIRGEVDKLTQSSRSDANEGVVRLFIRSNKIEDHNSVENDIRHEMANRTKDIEWTVQEKCKILTLEHKMAAKRFGFFDVYNTLYQITKWRSGLRDGTLPVLKLFTSYVLPLVYAQKDGDKFLVAQIMRKHSPLLSYEELKKFTQVTKLLKKTMSGISSLSTLCDNKGSSCGDILECVKEHRLFEIPEIFKPVIEKLNNRESTEPEDSEKDQVGDEIDVLLEFMETPFEQIDKYQKYISGESPFDTHQGIKGLEFDRVMVIMNDSEAGGFSFNYEKLLGDDGTLKNEKGVESIIDKTRRLFYVTCSRAEKSLALVAYCENPDNVKRQVLNKGWFSEDEIDLQF